MTRPPSRPQRGERARPVLTGRALVLGGIMILLVVLLASPIHRYLGSRGDVNHTAAQLAHDRAQLRDLQRQQARWSDPGYIQQQARSRLQYAMPGDTVYVVVNKGAQTQIEKTAGQHSKPANGTSWNTRLWDSVRAASR